MGKHTLFKDINTKVSLEPLMAFWESRLAKECSHMASLFEEIREQFSQAPDIQGEIDDIKVLDGYHHILNPLMSVVFPQASFDRDIMAALTPCTFDPFYATPEFQRLFMDNDHFIQSVLEKPDGVEIGKKRLKLIHLILDRVHGISCQRLAQPDIKAVPDQKTGLPRYYGFSADFRFVRIRSLSDTAPLSDADRTRIIDNLTDLSLLARYIDPGQYEFSGFAIVRATDVTESEVVSALERDLIDHHSIFSHDGIRLLEKRLQVLFQKPDLAVGIGAIQNDQVMIIKNDCNSDINCLFSNSHHIRLDQLDGSVWMEAAQGQGVLRVADLARKKERGAVEEEAVSAGIRSMLLAPLRYQGQPIGILEIFTPKPNDLGPLDGLRLEQVTPIFSVALKRGLDDMDKHVQAVIKEKCTAVHPSVEWRFERAAISHMDRLRNGIVDSEMDPIIFKDVVPFYGQSDIRGSSLARNKGIQKDLTTQLGLALDILNTSRDLRPWPILQQYCHRVETLLGHISRGVTSSDENAVFTLLHHEIAPCFNDLRQLGPGVETKIDTYLKALDPVTHMVYDRRKDYEKSVSLLNQSLSAYIDQEDSLIQESFPHYFEKRQTDGVDYMMYIGASMNEDRHLARFHIQDMTLWQMMLACGLALKTAQMKPRLKVPLDTCHLILVNHTPLSIRFRFDEKRFDVDGAYDARHEIIKSRLDKALVKGSGERLTQPGRIAIVYANPGEGKQIRQHIEFLTAMGRLENDMEVLELDDMPDVRGLKALRVGVNLAAQAGNVIEMKAG